MYAKGKGSTVPSDAQARENVFWDLYCAAPERRDTCEHSSEAKAFHDYGFVNSGYGVNGIAHRMYCLSSLHVCIPVTVGFFGILVYLCKLMFKIGYI
ncbi:Uncharacterized protein GBIM_10713 [Gryllus bimaculatus]|nr:Uncharacterized protein GBIM_10713 [Gryllus bimaculatus]